MKEKLLGLSLAVALLFSLLLAYDHERHAPGAADRARQDAITTITLADKSTLPSPPLAWFPILHVSGARVELNVDGMTRTDRLSGNLRRDEVDWPHDRAATPKALEMSAHEDDLTAKSPGSDFPAGEALEEDPERRPAHEIISARGLPVASGFELGFAPDGGLPRAFGEKLRAFRLLHRNYASSLGVQFSSELVIAPRGDVPFLKVLAASAEAMQNDYRSTFLARDATGRLILIPYSLPVLQRLPAPYKGPLCVKPSLHVTSSGEGRINLMFDYAEWPHNGHYKVYHLSLDGDSCDFPIEALLANMPEDLPICDVANVTSDTGASAADAFALMSKTYARFERPFIPSFTFMEPRAGVDRHGGCNASRRLRPSEIADALEEAKGRSREVGASDDDLLE